MSCDHHQSMSAWRRPLARRDVLVSLSSLAAALPFGLAGTARAAGASRPLGKRLILLWMDGGPSQFETFDPKPQHANGGPTQSIPTDVDGWHFSQHLPQLAKRAEHLCVVRSMTSREGNHTRAKQLVKSGYVPNPTVQYPSLGSIVSSELGNPQFDLPNFVQVNGAPSPSGYLGVEHSPLVVSKPGQPIDNLAFAPDVDRRRLDHRTRMLDVIENGFAKRGGQQVVDANRSLRERARRLMETRLRSAFDLADEREKTRTRYGDHRFGQGCLLARRLIETGVPAVEVVLGGWDTHDDNFNRCAELGGMLDTGFSALLDDLRERRLLDETVIVCMGEFGRTPRITGSDGRGHWPSNWFVTLAGAGVQTGQAFGATSEDGTEIAANPVTVPDLFATLSKLIGFDPDLEREIARRPTTLVDPEGKIVRELLRTA